MNIEYMNPSELIPYKKNAKLHPAEQVEHIANSIRMFGWTQPIVIDENNMLKEESEEKIILNGIPLEERPSVRERITKIINGNKDDNKENKLRREALKSVIDVGKEQPWKEMKYLRD